MVNLRLGGAVRDIEPGSPFQRCVCLQIGITNASSFLLSAKTSPQVSEEFEKLKKSNDTNRLLRYIIFKLSDDYSEFQVEYAEADSDWDNFRGKLLNATSKNKSVCLPIYSTLSLYNINEC
jgi:hypothetical protein